MKPIISTLRIGTCSWNYDSWVGLVYSEKKASAVEYLKEYAKVYNTAEIDSWFYRIPSRREVISYKSAVDSRFRFTCKVPQEITLTQNREKDANNKYIVNPSFLSIDRFKYFLGEIEPLIPQIDSIMFEFEYLNKQKMKSLDEFLDKLSTFFNNVPAGLPYYLEPRNKTYLTEKYFKFLTEKSLGHVLSEKLFMPHIYDIYSQFKDTIPDNPVIRLLGGDRGEIEEKTVNQWNQIVKEKNDKEKVVDMMQDLLKRTGVTANVNNHYEGSAPLTIKALKILMFS
jgi:uncharacterized protein YecE (DUF72 family)